jgi:hypothetical protein
MGLLYVGEEEGEERGGVLWRRKMLQVLLDYIDRGRYPCIIEGAGPSTGAIRVPPNVLSQFMHVEVY